ncbi:hypothetical protein BTH23_02230 [Acinetobacter baumannii]|nr:hypothetical protein BTH23_02230 [Acinetobacter baumannii]OOT02516.1 hypothetical protein BTH21_08325 [Acinetobacter baumannii]OOT91461.1 hypothetical protein BTH00_01855 [Acinetobacter baumannii]OOU03203.1 hypothetical protein BTH01_15735 [Acinetobacter baumannii]OOU10320.1 hypothetical protein BTG98_16415 [Acinetobacter baumannii]
MDVHSQLLILGVLPTLKLWWQNGSGLADLVIHKHTRRCPTPVLPLREETRSLHTRLFLRRNNSDAVLQAVC